MQTPGIFGPATGVCGAVTIPYGNSGAGSQLQTFVAPSPGPPAPSVTCKPTVNDTYTYTLGPSGQFSYSLTPGAHIIYFCPPTDMDDLAQSAMASNSSVQHLHKYRLCLSLGERGRSSVAGPTCLGALLRVSIGWRRSAHHWHKCEPFARVPGHTGLESDRREPIAWGAPHAHPCRQLRRGPELHQQGQCTVPEQQPPHTLSVPHSGVQTSQSHQPGSQIVQEAPFSLWGCDRILHKVMGMVLHNTWTHQHAEARLLPLCPMIAHLLDVHPELVRTTGLTLALT